MKVLIFSRGSAICGGVESINNSLCKELPKKGWQVKLALTEGDVYNKPSNYKEAFPEIDIIAVNGVIGSRQSRLEGIAHVLKNESPDIIINMRVFDVYEAVSKYKKKHRNVKFIAGLRCYEEALIYDIKLYSSNIDYVVTSGELLLNFCEKWANVDKDRIMSIGGGVKPPLIESKNNFVGNQIKLAYIGRLEQSQKRIYDLIPFLEYLDCKDVNYNLKIIGNGEEELKLRQKLSKWINNKKVDFIGYLTKEELYKSIYPKIDILIHFSHTEGITISPREAMVHGVIPIISNFSGLKIEKQFVHNHNALVFNVGDTDQAALNVIKLIHNRNLFVKLSKNASLSQSGKYSYSGSIDAWDTILKKVLTLPYKSGPIPNIFDRERGILKKIIPFSCFRERIRRAFNLKCLHLDPGSEWPTNSGMITESIKKDIRHIHEQINSHDLNNTVV